MKINFDTMKYYYLTTGNNKKRENHMEDIFKNYNIKKIIGPSGIKKHISGAIGHSKMIELGLREQDRNKPFQPFVILEDDVSFFRNLPNELEIPDNTDALYIGISPWGLNKDNMQGKYNHIIADDYNDDLIKVYNMLGTHAIMICSSLYASVYTRCMMESIYYNFQDRGDWDIILSTLQKKYNVYAFKNPFLYQDAKYGGQETTKVILNTFIKYDKKLLVDDIFMNNIISL